MGRGRFDAFRDTHPTSRKIFIVGMGRSGTHLLARSLDAHPDIKANIEDRWVFPQIVAIALDERQARLRYPLVQLALRVMHAGVAPRHLVDKSHPALWIAERLSDSFPQSLFIGVQRNAFAVIASALRHGGVRAWHKKWRKFPIPNRFLGISRELQSTYDSLSSTQQLAYRWLAHHKELARLEASLGDRFIPMSYESLVERPTEELSRIGELLGLRTPIPLPAIRRESLDRWQSELTGDEVDQIERIVGHE